MITEEDQRILRENEGKVFYLDVKSGIYSALYSYLNYDEMWFSYSDKTIDGVQRVCWSMVSGKISCGNTITSKIIFLTDEEVLTLINRSEEKERDSAVDDIANKMKMMLKGMKGIH
nr:MAG TPA: hypothetical protein [Bacteriophage sp.]